MTLALFIRCGAFCALLKRWEAWVKMRSAFGQFAQQGKYLVNLDDVLKGSKVSFVNLRPFFALGMMIQCGRPCMSDASGSFFWQVSIP